MLGKLALLWDDGVVFRPTGPLGQAGLDPRRQRDGNLHIVVRVVGSSSLPRYDGLDDNRIDGRIILARDLDRIEERWTGCRPP